MSSLVQEIEQAIKNNLPAAVGDLLRARLAEGDAAVSALKDLKVTMDGTQRRLADALTQCSTQEALKAREAASTRRELEVAAREVRADFKDLAVQMADKRAEDALALAHGVFANAKFKYTETRDVPVVRQYFNNGQPSGDFVSRDVTTHSGEREG